MSIEEIKQRVNQGITEYMHPDEKAEIYRNDAKLLLEREELIIENERLKHQIVQLERTLQLVAARPVHVSVTKPLEHWDL